MEDFGFDKRLKTRVVKQSKANERLPVTTWELDNRNRPPRWLLSLSTTPKRESQQRKSFPNETAGDAVHEKGEAELILADRARKPQVWPMESAQ